MAKWDFKIVGASFVKELVPIADDVQPRSQSFMQPSFHLEGGKIVIKESGQYVTAIYFSQIGEIAGVAPTDIDDAYAKLLTLVENFNGGGATSQTLAQTLASDNKTNQIPITSNDGTSSVQIDNNGNLYLQSNFGGLKQILITEEGFTFQSNIRYDISGKGILMNTNSDGFGLPRLTTTQMNAIAFPTEGMLIRNTTEGKIYQFNGTVWEVLGSGGTVTSVSGTTDEITVSSPTTTPVIGISSNYTTARDAYADAKVADNLTASTTVAPSKTAVNTALENLEDSLQGVIFNDAFNATVDATYTEVGSPTYSFGASGITLSGGAGTFAKYLSKGYTSSLENNEIVCDITPSVNGTGFAIGYQGVSSFTSGSIYAYINLNAVTNRGQLIISSSTDGTLATSASNLTYTTSTDNIRLIFRRNKYSFEFIAVNLTNNTIARVVYAGGADVGAVALGTIWKPSFYAHGGTQIVKNFIYSSNVKKGAKILWLGDSITNGMFGGGVNNRFSDIFASKTKEDIVTMGARGAESDDILQLTDEVLSLKPKYVIIAIGINDIRASVTLGTYQTNINTLVASLIQNDIVPIFQEILPTSNSGHTSTAVTWNTWLATLGYKVLATHAPLSSGGILNASYDCGDGVHLNTLGMELVADIDALALVDTVDFNRSNYSNVNAIVTTDHKNTSTGANATVRFRQISGAHESSLITYSATNANALQTGKTILFDNLGGLSFASNSATGVTRFYNGGFASANQSIGISSSGNVAVGSFASPVARFTVYEPSTIRPQMRLEDGSVTIPNFSSVGYSPALGTGTVGLTTSGTNGGYAITGITNTTAGAIPLIFVGNTGSTAPTVANTLFLARKHNGTTGVTALGNTEITHQFSNNGTVSTTILGSGNVGFGTTAPTATVHIKAGTATAGTAPLKLTSGTNLTTPEDGTFEFDGTNLYFTIGGVRKTVTLI